MSARDLVDAPRHLAERSFDVTERHAFDRGGHPVARERPHDYLVGVRAALAHPSRA